MKMRALGRHGLYPPRGGACSSFLVTLGDGRAILLDCGPGSLAKWPEGTLESLEAVVLTHLHWDHVSDALPLRYALERAGKRIALLLPEEPGPVYDLLIASPMIEAARIADGGGYAGDGYALSFARMRHPVPAYGVRLEADGAALAYSGDTNTCDSLVPLLRGADLALVDACFTDEQWGEDKPHLSARLAARAMAEAGVGRPLLTHIPPDGDEAALLRQAREERPDAAFAQEGRAWDVHA